VGFGDVAPAAAPLGRPASLTAARPFRAATCPCFGGSPDRPASAGSGIAPAAPRGSNATPAAMAAAFHDADRKSRRVRFFSCSVRNACGDFSGLGIFGSDILRPSTGARRSTEPTTGRPRASTGAWTASGTRPTGLGFYGIRLMSRQRQTVHLRNARRRERTAPPATARPGL
jgi:hypothetical protein